MRKLFLLLFFFLVFANASAQDKKVSARFDTKLGVVDKGYNFWVYTPANYEESDAKHPLIIFLHGASLCGRDLNRVRRYGVLNAIDRGRNIPALVVAPQNPGGAWMPSRINNVLQWVCENYRVDESRVYVMGMSLGGYGTLDFVGTYPEKVAAAMALCGGCSLKDQDGLSKLPLWIMHGTADRAVNVGESKKIVERLQEQKKTQLLRYTWIPGGDHGIPVRLFYLPQTYEWLFKHSLNDNPRKIDTGVSITPADIKSHRYR